MSPKELELVNKVDLRIALAESDSQLENALNLYLAPLLLKLASPDAQVRLAVFKSVQNIFPRITAARDLQLPVLPLLSQVKHPKVPLGQDAAQVRLYSLLFLSKGVERLSLDAQAALIPDLVRGISSFSTGVAARIFSILVKVLGGWKAPIADADAVKKTREAYHFDKNPLDELFLSEKFLKFFLLQPNSGAVPIQTGGMSVEDSAFFTREAGITYKTQREINDTKIRLFELMRLGFSDEALVVPLLIATTDSSSVIADRADMWYKKLTVDAEDKQLISTLVSLFTGVEGRFPPVKSTLQEKILLLLCKSQMAISHSEVETISNLGLLSEYAKLRQTAVAFIRKVTLSNSTAKSSDEFEISIAAKLKESIIADGWPEIDTSQVTNYRTAVGLRQLQYEALGDVLRNSPALWMNDLLYLVFLFDSLKSESSDMRPVLQDVLSRLTVHLPGLSSDCKKQLKEILREILVSSSHGPSTSTCRYLAIKYVNCTFPFDDAAARLLCILGTYRINNSETVEEASKGLHPYYFNLLQSSNSLDFESSLQFLGKKSEVRFPSFADMTVSIKDALKSADGSSPIFQCFGEAIRFTLRVLVMQAIQGKSTVIVLDDDWTSRIDKALEVDETVRLLVVSEIGILAQVDTSMDTADSSESTSNVFHLFLEMTFEALYDQYSGKTTVATDITYGYVFALLISMSPSTVIEKLIPALPKLLTLVNEKPLARKALEELCETVGIIGTHPSMPLIAVKDILTSLAAEGAAPHTVEARLLASTFLISRMVLRSRVKDLDRELVTQHFTSLLQSLSNARLYDTCLEAISQLAVFGALGPELNLADNTSSFVADIRTAIEPRAKACQELSVLTLSKISLALPETYQSSSLEDLNSVEKLVYDTHVSKQIEYIFASGEALLTLAGGWQSKKIQQMIDIEGETVAYMPSETGRLPVILDKVLKACSQTKPSLRTAACIWLLSIVQYLGHLPIIKTYATEIHVAFMRFLADRTELVQESASRGLSIIYELGDNDLKESLVKGLFKSFTDSKASSTLAAGTVDLETQLFEEDVLKTNDGSVSTYKDVLNLAADVGDPSLVYKFMSLAKSNALWSTRRGMAFGLGSILSKSSLDDMLAKNEKLNARLIPKLYRYRFDPNTQVSQSMNDIWIALVKDSLKTVRENFNIILDEVLKGMGSKEWRVRQASGAALNELLQTQSLEQYESRLEEIWNMSFRAMDDIKVSVRKEGNHLAKTLARIVIRTADVTTGNVTESKATEVLNNLIPFFLGNKGLLSDAEDIRNFALETILKLCKTGGKAVKPHVPHLLGIFVELMSTLEPEIVNYLVLNADKYNLKSSEVDAKRLQSLGHSPMMDAVEQILGLLDELLMAETVQLLRKCVKKSVGLPSKVCGSRVIVSLITKHYAITIPYGDKLLEICVGQLGDRNSTISSSYAAAAGYCCKIASIDAVLAYSDKIKGLYLESADENSRLLAGVASEAVSRYCGSDRFEAVASAFLPLAFIGRHDIDESIKEVFEKEWIESSSGNSAIKHYFEEICQLCEEHGKSNNYEIRKIVAGSIADMCTAIDVDSEREATRLITIILDSCQGKSWSGKEVVFKALITFALKKIDFLRSHVDILKQVERTVTTEAKRRNKYYQMKVILDIGNFIKAFSDDEGLINIYIEIMSDVETDDYFEDVDIDMGHSDSKVHKSQIAVAVEELYLSYIGNTFDAIDTSNINLDLLKFAFESMKKFKESGHELSWRTCFSYNEFMKKILDPLAALDVDFNFDQLKALADGFRTVAEFGEQYRLQKNVIIFARNSKLILEIFKANSQVPLGHFVLDKITSLKSSETSSVVLNELDQVTM